MIIYFPSKSNFSLDIVRSATFINLRFDLLTIRLFDQTVRTKNYKLENKIIWSLNGSIYNGSGKISRELKSSKKEAKDQSQNALF